MYDEELFLGLRFYEIFFFLGLVAALIIFTVYSNKKKMPPNVQNFYLNLSIAAIAGGYLSAFLFQAIYNFFATGVFKFEGITFLGGLAGGAAVFLGGYKLFAKQSAKEYFSLAVEIAPCSILIAHALGRIGCFMAGCCHGIQTDSIFGIQFPGDNFKVYPTQLFESIFLFIMFAVTTVLLFKNKNINFIVYLISYGIFRFLLEFIRGDYRGDFIIPFLSPSQTLSLAMVILGGYLLYRKIQKDKNINKIE